MYDSEKQALLRWRCRRGMLELDLLFRNFFDACFQDLSAQNQQAFAELLTAEDQHLYEWLFGYKVCPNANWIEIMNKIKNYAATKN